MPTLPSTATVSVRPGSQRWHRRHRFVLALSAVAVLFLGVGFAAAWYVKSPAQVAAEAKPPTAGLITAPLSKRAISNTVIVRGDAGYSDATDVTVGAYGSGGAPAVVSGHVPAAGEILRPGSVALELSSRPVIVLPGSLPAFRTLRVGVSGADVLQFKAALQALGIDSGDPASNLFDEATASAVSELYSAVGYPAPKDDSANPMAQRSAQAGVRAAQQRVASAQQALDAASRGPSEVDRLMAQQAVDMAQQQLDAASASGQSASISSAQTALALAKAQQAAISAPKDTTALEAAVEDAQAALADAQAALADAQRAALPIVPAAELLYLADLPRQVDKIAITYGEAVGSAPVMSVAGTTLMVIAHLSDRDAGQIKEGAPATIDLPGVTPIPVTVRSIAGAADGGGSDIVLEPAQELSAQQRAAVAGQNVRIVIPVNATAGEVWAVPLAAVTAGPDGAARIEVVTDAARGRTRLVPVTLGLSADGYVEVTGVDQALDDQMLIVLGR